MDKQVFRIHKNIDNVYVRNVLTNYTEKTFTKAVTISLLWVNLGGICFTSHEICEGNPESNSRLSVASLGAGLLPPLLSGNFL